MIVVEKGTVQHNGRLYGPGEIIQGLKKREAERLVKLGACREIADAAPPADTGNAPGTGTAGTPDAPPEAPKTGTAGETDGIATPALATVEDLGLSVSPAATIKTTK